MTETEHPLLDDLRSASEKLAEVRYGTVPSRYEHALATMGLAHELGSQLARLDVSWSDLVEAERTLRETLERRVGRPYEPEARDVIGVALQNVLDATRPTD